METYLAHVQKLSYHFITLLAEAFGLPSDALNRFYDRDELMQHRGKVRLKLTTRYYTALGIDTRFQVVKYPANDGSLNDQGVGPHYDAGFLTFVSAFRGISNFVRPSLIRVIAPPSFSSPWSPSSEPFRRMD